MIVIIIWKYERVILILEGQNSLDNIIEPEISRNVPITSISSFVKK